MIKSIQRLRRFGVFDDFTKPAQLSEFVEKNVIFGWNYSGKTTLSRFFSSLAQKKANSDFPTATFNIVDNQGQATTELSLETFPKKLEVFNSDFVANNLSWSGEAFEPILLLGSESIEAEKKIAQLEDRVIKCREGYARKRGSILAADNKLAEAKTAEAKRVKTLLQLVEAYTATQLAADISHISNDPDAFLLADADFATDIKLALSSEKDKAKKVGAIRPPELSVGDMHAKASDLLSKNPAASATIDYLRENPQVANWILQGLQLHEGNTNCEFCRGEFTAARESDLRNHFSTELLNHKKLIEAAIAKANTSVVSSPALDARDISERFVDRISIQLEKVGKLVVEYNKDVHNIASALTGKLADPFSDAPAPVIFPGVGPVLSTAIDDLNSLIHENNKLSDSFSEDKRLAVQRLRRHFAAEFIRNQDIGAAARYKSTLMRHRDRFQAIGVGAKSEIELLKAQIDRSQKGRERLNQRIATLIGTSSIQIVVVIVDGSERFQLRRGESAARNLSDGERTAIAFAYFLTKLEEHGDLSDIIVYIDDPISSLDSNHVFQVYSMIETTFFRKVPTPSGGEEWVTSCSQIFISTHNFEFFELLKRLPCNKNKTRYFLIRRTSLSSSVLEDLPTAMLKYRSEYHYLFSVIHAFHSAPDQSDVETLLSLPNAMRRFFELYTYMRLPWPESTVDQRAEALFGREKTLRIIKLLHHFSHLESIDRVATNTNLVADIGAVVAQVMELLELDEPHLSALKGSLPAVATT